MKHLVIIGLLVALGLVAGCEKKQEPQVTQINPPEPIGGLREAPGVPEPTPAGHTGPVVTETTPLPPPPPPEPSQRVHVVERGDTLWRISRQYYGTATKALVQKIIDANPGITPDRISVGQKIIVPD